MLKEENRRKQIGVGSIAGQTLDYQRGAESQQRRMGTRTSPSLPQFEPRNKEGSLRRGKQTCYAPDSTALPTDKFWRYKFHCLISDFNGEMCGDKFVEWIMAVDKFFEFRNILDEEKMEVITQKLVGDALSWWVSMNVRRERMGKHKIRGWELMKRVLKEKYLPDTYKHKSLNHFLELKQGARSIIEYAREFELLVVKCDLGRNEDVTLRQFVRGLDDQVSSQVEVRPKTTLDELIMRAREVGRQKQFVFVGSKPDTLGGKSEMDCDLAEQEGASGSNDILKSK